MQIVKLVVFGWLWLLGILSLLLGWLWITRWNLDRFGFTGLWVEEALMFTALLVCLGILLDAGGKA